jgi:hypothetical protein
MSLCPGVRLRGWGEGVAPYQSDATRSARIGKPRQRARAYAMLYAESDSSALWFSKVTYALSPKEVAAREAESQGAG